MRAPGWLRAGYLSLGVTCLIMLGLSALAGLVVIAARLLGPTGVILGAITTIVFAFSYLIIYDDMKHNKY